MEHTHPLPIQDDIETAQEIADMWGFSDNPSFKNVIAMALNRARRDAVMKVFLPRRSNP